MCLAPVREKHFASPRSGAAARKLLLVLDRESGDEIALVGNAMQLTIRTKVTCGFLLLAFGMMLTDVCRLVRNPSEATLSVANSAAHARKFSKHVQGGV
jgi:hypothetical protein